MKKVGILNAYDVMNRGDRAIVEAQIGWVRSCWPTADIVVFSSHHESNRGVFGDHASAFAVIEAPLAASPLGKLVAPLRRWLEFRFRWRNRREYDLFRECDVFLICGGGYLYSSPSPLLSRQLMIHCVNALLAIASGKPVLAFPQSWGPLRKGIDKWCCRRLAQRLAIVTTRGRQSSELVREMGFGDKVMEVPDVVLAIRRFRPEFFPERSDTGEEPVSLGMAPINWSFERELSDTVWSRYLEAMTALARKWTTATGGMVTLIPQVAVEGHDDDRLVCEELASRFSAAGISFRYDGDLSWDDHWQMIARQKVFVGCRMHACIFALVSHVPTIGLAYQPKFHELYGQLELREYSHEIDRFDAELVAEQIMALSHEENLRRTFCERVDGMAWEVDRRMAEAWTRSSGAVRIREGGEAR
jgi:colanic acid/amylovoran biosynthesis protein